MYYPKGIIKNNSSFIQYGNRGMNLEADINDTNKYYLDNDIANIHKKPTAITISSVDYKSRTDAVIKEAYFKTPSTTDYNGIYKSKYIDFEAKETKLDYFPLRNIHAHQIKHLFNIVKHGGIGFLIVRFTKYNKTFYLDAIELKKFIDNNKRKSITLDYFEQHGFLLKEGLIPRLDYLKIIDTLYLGGCYEEKNK